jgi:hypothetical protein
MLRKLLVALFLTVALLLLAFPAMAGGAATVNLDEVPTDVRAGDPLHLTFIIRQHDVRPVDEIAGVGPLVPYLEATNSDTGETLRVDAYKPEGAEVGHFAVDVTFPSAGTWEWQIYPEPFALINEFEPLAVQEAQAVAPVAAQVSGASATTFPALLGWGAALALVAAVVLLFARRQTSRQPAPAPQR